MLWAFRVHICEGKEVISNMNRLMLLDEWITAMASQIHHSYLFTDACASKGFCFE